MTKRYLKLTKDQRARGVIFSSVLIEKGGEDGDRTIHEVFATDGDKDLVIKRLLDDSFFDGSMFKYNLIRR